MSRYSHHGYRIRLKALRHETKKHGLPCWLCGQPIDLTLPPLHRMAFTGDHIDPIANGGSMTGELRPAHRACNSRRGKGNRNNGPKKPITTRQW